jgi:phage terminase large subunit
MDINLLSQYKPFATKPYRYKVVYGGRGKGATWQIARILLLKAMESPERILCTREFQNSINESVHEVLRSQIELLELPGFKVANTSIKHEKGSQFFFKGLRHNIDSIKSIEGITKCWIAEADKVPQSSWDKLIPTVRTKKSEFFIDFNIDSEDDPVYKMFVDDKRSDAYVLFQTYNDNPYFPDVLRSEMEHDKEYDYDKFLWVWEGKARSVTEACVFHGKFTEDDFITPGDAEFFHGVDWGFSQDPTAAVRCFIHANNLFIDRCCGGVGVDIDKTPDLLDEIPTMRTWSSIADSARPETISHMQNHGFPKMKGAKKGKGSVEDGVEKIKSFDRIIVHTRCEDVLNELKLYSYKRNRLTGEIMPILEDRHNHYVDALRYALEPYGKKKLKIRRY